MQKYLGTSKVDSVRRRNESSRHEKRRSTGCAKFENGVNSYIMLAATR